MKCIKCKDEAIEKLNGMWFCENCLDEFENLING